MIDKEKVIKGLEHCDKESDCRSCIYSKQMEGRYKSYRCDCIADALALLKEQETEIRQLKLALDIAKGTCKGIRTGGD